MNQEKKEVETTLILLDISAEVSSISSSGFKIDSNNTTDVDKSKK